MHKRLIATLILKNNIVVQSIGFEFYLPIGKPEIAVEFLNNWGIDEIIVLDIDATKNNKIINPYIVKSISKKCFVPLTVGGGIKCLQDAEILLKAGADKICINQSVRKNLDLISKLANCYGSQFVIGSIDIIRNSNKYFVFDYVTGKMCSIDMMNFIKLIEKEGAGEIFINAVHKDGRYSGYDINLYKKICNNINIPVIASGGAKNARDILKLFKKSNVSAASVSNYFNFYEHSVTIAKGFLEKHGIYVRNDTYDNYSESNFDIDCRLIKKEDINLEKMRFIQIKKEKI